eukprot:m.259545 g.259545  ORF g.259545 m.259545 type:complete len:154 (+) comp15555_c0_seq1:3746-4207(+)
MCMMYITFILVYMDMHIYDQLLRVWMCVCNVAFLACLEQLAYFRENPIAPHVQCAMRLFEWCCNAGMVAGAQVLHTALSDANVLASYPSSSQRALRQKWKASFLATQPKEEQAKTHYDHLSPDPTVFSSLSSNVHLQRSKMIECLAYVYPDVV